MKPVVLPCIPACDCKFHTLAVYLHSAFTAPSQSEAYLEHGRTYAMELFYEKS